MVRPDTRGQFQRHVVTQQTVGRLLVFDLATLSISFFMASVALAAHDVSNGGRADSLLPMDEAETALMSKDKRGAARPEHHYQR